MYKPYQWIVTIFWLCVLGIRQIDIRSFECQFPDEVEGAGFFCADDSAFPLAHEKLFVDDLAQPFHALRAIQNIDEDWWLIHPANSRYVVIDIGIHRTGHQVECDEKSILDYLVDRQPAWFVLMHPHPSGTARNPSATDLFSHWRMEQALIQRQVFMPFASVVVFDEGYFVFKPSENLIASFIRIRDDTRRYLQIDKLNIEWYQFQVEWDFQTTNYGLSTDNPDFAGYADAVHDKADLVFAATSAEVVASVYELLSVG